MEIIEGNAGSSAILSCSFSNQVEKKQMEGKALPVVAHYPLVGNNLEFNKCPVNFLEKHSRELGSEVIKASLMNKNICLVKGHEQVTKVLNDDKKFSFELAHIEYTLKITKNSIMALESNSERHQLAKEFNLKLIYSAYFNQRIKNSTYLIKNKLVECSDYVEIYSKMKDLSQQILFKAFLDINIGDELYKKVSGLLKLLWKGQTSVPIRGFTNFSKGEQAYKELLIIITDQIKSMDYTGSVDQICSHIILYIGALVVKSFASLFTFIILEINNHISDLRSGELSIEWFIFEIERMHPPVYGVPRTVEEDTNIDGFRVPKGHHIWTCFVTANRDDKVYENPNNFNPYRWKDAAPGLAYGAGKRSCLGKEFCRNLCLLFVQTFYKEYDIQVKDEYGIQMKDVLTEKEDLENESEFLEGLDKKYLPVNRPREKIYFKFAPV
jgi:hypothetical protein